MSAKKVSVRLMAPFSMQCEHCKQYIYKNTKFNARKSNTGEKYLGITIIQFSFRCSSCSSEILIRTDPKLGDYQIVKGASRTLGSSLPNSSEIGGSNTSSTGTSVSKRETTDEAPKSSPGATSNPPTEILGSKRAELAHNINAQKKKLPIPKPRKHLLKIT